jgi:invasion protein IalB
MAAFAVISLTGETNAALAAAITGTYPDAELQIAPYAWFVADADTATTQEVCKKLNIQVVEGAITNAIVIRVDSYWGRAPRNIWEWLSVKSTSI